MYTIKPTVNPNDPYLFGFPVESLNRYATTEMFDTFSPYQRAFGLYSFMKLNNKRKFKITYPKHNTMLWQPAKACSFDPLGGFTFGNQEIAPCEAKVNAELCTHDLIDSCFEGLLAYNKNEITEAQLAPMLNDVLRLFSENTMEGALQMLTMGQFYSNMAINFEANTAQNLKDLFAKTANTCKGWVKLQKDLAASSTAYSHLNVGGILSPDAFDGDRYTGGLQGILDIFAALKARATPTLRKYMTHSNNVPISGTRAVIVVDESMFAAIVDAYNIQCLPATACNNMRITLRNQGGLEYYAIDGLPVVPVPQINDADMLLSENTHYFAITLTGNISLGSSFDEVDFTGNRGNGIVFERGRTLRDNNIVTIKSEALFANTILDTDMMVGSILTDTAV